MKQSIRLTTLFGLILLVGVVHAADEPFTLQQVMSPPFPSEMRAAPRGNRIAWVFNAQGRRNIWVSAGPSFAARQMTHFGQDDGQEISDLDFASDGNAIVFVRGGPKNRDGVVPNPTSDPAGTDQAIWVMRWNARVSYEPRKVDSGNSPAISPHGDWVAYVKDDQIWLAPLRGTGKPTQIVVRGKNGSPVWSPDGRRLAFVSDRGDHSLITIYAPAKKTLAYIAPSVDSDRVPRWAPTSQSIAFVRRPARKTDEPTGGILTAEDRPNPWAIWVADVSSGKGREVWRSTPTLEGSFPYMARAMLLHWVAEDRIVFASEEDGWQHLYSIPAAGGGSVLLTPGECEVEQMALTPDRRTIIYSSNCGDIDRRHLWRASVAGGAPEPLTTGEGIEWSPVITSDGRWIAYLASGARQPAMPFIRAAKASAQEAGKMLAASALPKDFPSTKLVVPQQIITHAADGTKLHNQLFVPMDLKPGERRPAVVFMHGGPMRQMLLGWHYLEYYYLAYAMNQFLASRGYVVLSVNYRSGIGYGREFRQALKRGARGASEYQDIVAAARYLQSRPDVDLARIGLWGGSYGGYLTAMGLARNSDLFAAGVDLHGVHDWSGSRFVQSGGLEGDRKRVARESSPIATMEQWKSPILLVHGDDDRNVSFTETVDLVARLRDQKVPFEQLIFPDEIHDFLLHRHWREVFSAAGAFFDRYLRPTPSVRAPSSDP